MADLHIITQKELNSLLIKRAIKLGIKRISKWKKKKVGCKK